VEVEENYRRAGELAERLGDTALLSQALYGMANMYEYRGAYEIAEHLVRQRLRLDVEAAALSRMESHELLTCSYLHQGRYRESVEHGEQAMAAFDGSGPLEGDRLVLAVQAHGWMSGALVFAGRLDDALVHSAEALRLADEGGDDLARASAAIQAAFTRLYCGRANEVSALAERGLAIAQDRRFPFHAACGRILRGWCRSADGHHAEALAEIRAGIAACRAVGALMDLPVFLALLAESLARSGDTAGALASLDDALAIVESGRSFFYEPELHRMRAMLMHDARAPRPAVLEALQTAHDRAVAQGSPLFVARVADSLRALNATPDSAPHGPATGSSRARKRRRAVQSGTV
jgi:tetratricopeptide (TPR) repeat protein